MFLFIENVLLPSIINRIHQVIKLDLQKDGLKPCLYVYARSLHGNSQVEFGSKFGFQIRTADSVI